MMHIHKSTERGLTSAPWLVSRHSFSFNNWYRPDRVQFGALRVLNDDLITGGGGFPPHSHQDMEIITIPLQGGVAHEDSSGGKGIVRAGQIQIMSAGTGVVHSEYNASETEPLELLQVWILPERPGLAPRYDECQLQEVKDGEWQVLASPDGQSGSLKIFQQAWVSRALLRTDQALTYTSRRPGNGMYVFIISGAVRVGDVILYKRDAVAFENVSEVQLTAMADADVIVFDVPLGS